MTISYVYVFAHLSCGQVSPVGELVTRPPILRSASSPSPSSSPTLSPSPLSSLLHNEQIKNFNLATEHDVGPGFTSGAPGFTSLWWFVLHGDQRVNQGRACFLDDNLEDGSFGLAFVQAGEQCFVLSWGWRRFACSWAEPHLNRSWRPLTKVLKLLWRSISSKGFSARLPKT